METKVQIQDNRILVPVTISNIGIDISAHLLLDTGASHTVLHREIAEPLRIITLAKGYAKTAGGSTVFSEMGSVDLLKVGPIVMKGAQIIVLSHKGAPACYDGLLGMNFLSRVNYSIDYERQVIRWQVR
jgi:predicted aspartyl protease